MTTRRDTGGTATIAVAFGLSAAASIGLTVLYGLGGQPQLEGFLLGIALGGLAVGLVVWAKRLMPPGPHTEHRETVPPQTAERPEAEADLEAGAEAVERRGFLVKMLGAALAALGAAALFPIRSLGTRPGRTLFHTAWREGARLVTPEGEPVRTDEVPVNGVLTVFPEGHTDAADSPALLIRLPPGLYRPPPGREGWSPDGFVAFSKICTHAGCPVGLYQADSHELFCPCHQSVFAVLRAALPTEGPATRPLPQLPLAVDDEGFLTAAGDFSEPVGPGFWSRGRG